MLIFDLNRIIAEYTIDLPTIIKIDLDKINWDQLSGNPSLFNIDKIKYKKMLIDFARMLTEI